MPSPRFASLVLSAHVAPGAAMLPAAMLPAELPGTALLTAAQDWILALAALALILALGTALGQLLGSRSWGVPEALLAGCLGLLIAPAGPLPLLPPRLLAVWQELPLILLTLVFGTLLVGKPLPRPARLWRPLSAQLLLALTFAFGQFLVAALVVQALAGRVPGIHPLMACLIEVAYEGGHGSAAAMGPTYARLGFPGGEALGLAMATVGLLTSTLVGGLVVVLGRQAGWLQAAAGQSAQPAAAAGSSVAAAGAPDGPFPAACPAAAASPGAAATRPTVVPAAPAAEAEALPAAGGSRHAGRDADQAGASAAVRSHSPAAPPATAFGNGGSVPPGRLAAWAVNLALAGVAVALGWLGLVGLQLLAARIGGGFQAVIEAFPVFPLAIIGSLLVRLLLERSGQAALASGPIQGLVAALSADLLITAATASLDLSLLAKDWIPLTALALAGLLWNLGVVLLLAPRILPSPWFERGILEFGQATGVAASGLLLLRMADPLDRSDALPPFSIKQLLLQPLIAGGVITVLAPLAITSLGLPLWSALCLLLVLLWIGLALLLARRAEGAGASP